MSDLVSLGQITTSAAISGTQTIYVTATNPYGTTQIPVTITCGTSGGSGGTSNGVTFPIFTQTQYSIAAGTSTIGTVIGAVAVVNPTGTTYSLASSSSFFSVNPQTGQVTVIGTLPCGVVQNFAVVASNAAGSSSTIVSVTPASCGGSSTTTMRFPIAQYTFVPAGTAACAAGGVVGQLSVIGAPGAVIYTIVPNSGAGAVGYTVNNAGW